MPITKRDAVVGCLLGTAVGDAIGLPCEGLSRLRLRRLYPKIEGHHLFFGRGMTSDDTEHTCMVGQALIASGGEVEAFVRSLAWRLRFWLLGLPAGIGLATLRALLKLWVGFSGHRSGVFSAGNGPAMRSAILGAAAGSDLTRLHRLVRATTRITHTDPKAEWGAWAVALAALHNSHGSTYAHRPERQSRGAGESGVSPEEYYAELKRTLDGEGADEFLNLIRGAAESVAQRETTEAFASKLGLSRAVTGYTFHTVPVALHAWMSHPKDFRSAVARVVSCGGDTDTVAAIVGGIIGAGVGKDGIPADWLEGLWEWPRTVQWMEELGRRLAEASGGTAKQKPVPLQVWGLWPRNLLFLVIVLGHGVRRLFPPY